MRIATMLVSAAALLATGCQSWGPTWSEITGARYTHADPNRRPVELLRVGGESVGLTERYFKVAPGTYRVEVQAPPRNRMSGSAMGFTLELLPCRRYYVNAEFDTRVGPEWTPVIDYVEPIAGCTVTG